MEEEKEAQAQHLPIFGYFANTLSTFCNCGKADPQIVVSCEEYWICPCKEAVKELDGAKVAGERIRVEAGKLV